MFELLNLSAHSKTSIQKLTFLFNSNWLVAGQSIYLLVSLVLSPRLELRTLTGHTPTYSRRVAAISTGIASSFLVQKRRRAQNSADKSVPAYSCPKLNI